MNDLISRQAAIKAICEDGTWLESQGCTEITMVERKQRDVDLLSELPSAQPASYQQVTGKLDCISRQAAIDALTGMIDRFERILADIRESKVDDSVCGMCEYDGAYMGQSGDWCNECPGFDEDDCFKLSDKCRKRWIGDIALPPSQPEIIRCKDCKHGVDYYHDGDCYCSNPKWGLRYFGGSWEFYCAAAERRSDE